MCIFAVMREDHVRRDCVLQLFENRFDLGTGKRQEAIGERLQQWPLESSGVDEQRSRVSSFSLPDAKGAEHHPVKHAALILLDQPQDGAATANFDIVGMGA